MLATECFLRHSELEDQWAMTVVCSRTPARLAFIGKSDFGTVLTVRTCGRRKQKLTIRLVLGYVSIEH